MNKMAKGQPKRDSKGRFIKGIVPINKIKLPYNELKKLYKSFGASMIAKKYNISKSTVCRSCHYKIHRRKEIELCQTEMEKDQDQEVQDQVGLVEV
jgi:DNA invertase Pin-like site-specific DNA recombinase